MCCAHGDPHYTTFDSTHGSTYDFMGTCEYEVVSPCSNGTDIPWFITAKVIYIKV